MLAIISNSDNPDMREYFSCKFDLNINGDIHFYSSSPESFKNEDILTSTKVKKNKISVNIFFDFSIICQMLKDFRKKKIKYILFDNVHVANVFQILIFKAFGYRIISTIHDYVPHPGSKSIFIAIYNRVFIHFLSDSIIAFSKKFTSKKNVSYVCLGGIDHQFSPNDVHSRKYIFFNGRLESYKGMEHLPKIQSFLAKHHPNKTLLVAGSGYLPNKEYLESCINVQVHNSFISETELNNYFDNSLLTILPYNHATQSGVLIRSFSRGVPVVAFDVGSLGEYVCHGENGFISEQNNLVEFCNHIDRAILSYDHLSHNTKKIFQQKFSKSAFITQYQSFINILKRDKN